MLFGSLTLKNEEKKKSRIKSKILTLIGSFTPEVLTKNASVYTGDQLSSTAILRINLRDNLKRTKIFSFLKLLCTFEPKTHFLSKL